MKDKIKISVAVITYNQQDTIAQTLDSILCQQGSFDLELVIGEDCSTDTTYAICQEYAERYPNVVRLLPNTHNLGITANYFRTLQACTGVFIGDIAGDDYYCDEYALEKQKNYLLSHPEVGVLGANGYRYYVRRNKKEEGLNPIITTIADDGAKAFYFSPNYRGGVYLKPIGTMIRREVLQYIDYDEILRRNLPVEDYPMQAIWSQYTQFACMPDLLVTYRIYEESATFISYNHPKYMQYHRGLAETRRYLNELFPMDACFTETMLQEQLFYKEYLLYLHRRDYAAAKQLIKNANAIIADSAKVRQAKRFTRTWLHFIAFHFYKKYTDYKQLYQRT